MHLSIPSRTQDRLPGSSGFKSRRGGTSIFGNYLLNLRRRLRIWLGTPSSTSHGRRALRLLGVLMMMLLLGWLLVRFVFDGSSNNRDRRAAKSVQGARAIAYPVVLVLGLDSTGYKDDYLAKIVQNRKEYAEKHGKFDLTRNPACVNLARFCVILEISVRFRH